MALTAALTLSGACSQQVRQAEIVHAAPSATAVEQPSGPPEPPVEPTRPPGKPVLPLTDQQAGPALQAGSARLPGEDDAERWLFVLEAVKDVDGGLATGSFDVKGNKIRIHTENVKRFSIDVSRLAIDWDRLVVIRINGVGSELRKRDYDVLHWVRDEHGRWKVEG